MSLRPSFQLVLRCYFSVIALTTGYTAENIFGADQFVFAIDELGTDEMMDFNP
jgi:hypothetical protein